MFHRVQIPPAENCHYLMLSVRPGVPFLCIPAPPSLSANSGPLPEVMFSVLLPLPKWYDAVAFFLFPE